MQFHFLLATCLRVKWHLEYATLNCDWPPPLKKKSLNLTLKICAQMYNVEPILIIMYGPCLNNETDVLGVKRKVGSGLSNIYFRAKIKSNRQESYIRERKAVWVQARICVNTGGIDKLKTIEKQEPQIRNL